MRLLFPEVEVTRSLYSNLVKWNYMNPTQEEARIIDSNERVAKRLEALAAQKQAVPSQGFVSGLDAEVVDMDALFQDIDEEGVPQNNVIKAGEDAEAVRMQMQQEVDSIMEEAYAEAERIKNEANALAMAERNRILSEAKSQGYAEGMEKAKKENEQLQRGLKEKAIQLEEEYQTYIDELEPRFIDTITGIYEHIFHVELEAYRDILVYLISTTIRKVENNHNFMVHVSKDDYPYVSMQKKQLAAGATSPNAMIEVVEDLTLSKNECLIETEGGIFDCSLGTQLAELGQKIRLLSYEKEKR